MNDDRAGDGRAVRLDERRRGIVRLPEALGRLPVYVPADTGLYKVARVVLPLVAQAYRLEASGTEHLPLDGPALLAVNHQSDFDPWLVGVAFPRPMKFLAKSELFRVPVLQRLIVALGAFPIERGVGDREALRRSLDVLAAGEVLLMFPEGTRHTDGRVHDFQPGVGMLALRSGAPVIPVAMKGNERFTTEGRLRFPKVRLMAGPPVDLSSLEGRRSEMYLAAAARIHEAVSGLYARL